MSEILIIGAGPAGLAMAGRLTKAGLSFDIVEKASDVGSSWRRHYDRLKLHTVKKYSSLPHLEFPENYPKFVSKDELVQYMEDYQNHFNLDIQFKTEIERIERTGNDWVVKQNNEEKIYRKVIVATGVNRVPFYPDFEGFKTFTGEVTHSRNYKNPNPFINKKVLVIGMGNTGAEVALDLCNHAVETAISVRSKVNIVPLEFLGRASQETAFTLNKLPKPMARSISKLAQKLAIGDLTRYGLPKPDVSPIEQLSKTGKTPVIDLGTVKVIKDGKINIYPDIKRFSENIVEFTDGRKDAFDHIILCTGYKSQLEDFIPNIEPFLDENANPKSWRGEKEMEGMYFLGFDLFKAGGILGVINDDSEKILYDIQETLTKEKAIPN